jgi:hypothetical protein
MKPIDKALELVSEYRNLTEECNCLEYTCVCFTMWDFKAKQCALITVNQILENNYGSWMQMKFWEEVKQELEKL